MPLETGNHSLDIAYWCMKFHTTVNVNKCRDKRRFRKRSPAQHAAFLEHVAQLEFEIWDEQDVQMNFNNFYDTMYTLYSTSLTLNEKLLLLRLIPISSPRLSSQCLDVRTVS